MDGVGGVLPDTDNGDDILIVSLVMGCIVQQSIVRAFFFGFNFFTC